ncbi:MAG: hypothetical protein PHX43_06185 [Alphaproteobacteria bacterium]|nr:hypothetical protein [Alphaproteobacteria bacterium]
MASFLTEDDFAQELVEFFQSKPPRPSNLRMICHDGSVLYSINKMDFLINFCMKYAGIIDHKSDPLTTDPFIHSDLKHIKSVLYKIVKIVNGRLLGNKNSEAGTLVDYSRNVFDTMPNVLSNWERLIDETRKSAEKARKELDKKEKEFDRVLKRKDIYGLASFYPEARRRLCHVKTNNFRVYYKNVRSIEYFFMMKDFKQALEKEVKSLLVSSDNIFDKTVITAVLGKSEALIYLEEKAFKLEETCEDYSKTLSDVREAMDPLKDIFSNRTRMLKRCSLVRREQKLESRL